MTDDTLDSDNTVSQDMEDSVLPDRQSCSLQARELARQRQRRNSADGNGVRPLVYALGVIVGVAVYLGVARSAFKIALARQDTLMNRSAALEDRYIFRNWDMERYNRKWIFGREGPNKGRRVYVLFDAQPRDWLREADGWVELRALTFTAPVPLERQSRALRSDYQTVWVPQEKFGEQR